MAITLDATSSLVFSATGTRTWSHSGGSPKGVLVLVSHGNSSDLVGSVSYGGVALTEVSNSPFLRSSTDPGSVHAFFLGSSVPSGTQTVSVGYSGAGANAVAACYTVNASADTEVQATDIDIYSDSTTSPSGTIALGGNSCFVAFAWESGINATSAYTVSSGFTNTIIYDYGTECGGVDVYNTIGTSDVTYGWTQLVNSAIAIAVAVKESAGGGTTVNLSGLSAAGAVGSLSHQISPNVALAGALASGAVGSIGFSIGTSVTPSGVSGAGSAGSITVSTSGNATVNISGVQAASNVGTFTFSISPSVSITGVQALGQVGTTSVITGMIVTPTGVATTGAAGTVTVTADVQLTLSGVSASGQVGTVTVGGAGVSVNLNGVYADGAIGAMSVLTVSEGWNDVTLSGGTWAVVGASGASWSDVSAASDIWTDI